MDVFEADAQQREEELHRWWQENWKSIVMGIVLAIAIITVVFMYRDYTKKVKYQNAVDFYAIVMNSDLSDANSVNDVKKFIGDHSSDVYSQLASLSLAKQYVAEKKYQKAADLLKASIGASRDNILDDVIRLRVARLNIELKKFDEANAVLDAITNREAFKFEVASLKGDAAYANKDNAAALKFYEEALSSAKTDDDTNVVKMKRDSLKTVKGVTAVKAAEKQEGASQQPAADVKAEEAVKAEDIAAKTVAAEESAAK